MKNFENKLTATQTVAFRRYRRKIYTIIGYYTGIICGGTSEFSEAIENNWDESKLKAYKSIEEFDRDRLKCAEIVDSFEQVPDELLEKVERAIKEMES